MRPGTILDGMKTEAAEAQLNIILGMNVCRKWFPKGLLNSWMPIIIVTLTVNATLSKYFGFKVCSNCPSDFAICQMICLIHLICCLKYPICCKKCQNCCQICPIYQCVQQLTTCTMTALCSAIASYYSAIVTGL